MAPLHRLNRHALLPCLLLHPLVRVSTFDVLALEEPPRFTARKRLLVTGQIRHHHATPEIAAPVLGVIARRLLAQLVPLPTRTRLRLFAPPSLQRDCHPAPTRTRHAVDPPTSKATIRPAPFGKASTPSSTRAPPAQPNVNFGEPREIDLDLDPDIDMLQSDNEMEYTAPSSKAAPVRSASEKEPSQRRTESNEMRY